MNEAERAKLRDRFARHLRTCLYCRSTPEDQPPACGQRIRIEEDMGYDRNITATSASS